MTLTQKLTLVVLITTSFILATFGMYLAADNFSKAFGIFLCCIAIVMFAFIWGYIMVN